jgi:NAD(P)-dependent dehydrogenase (short-subunit alcohol dehydrogenase family)
MNDKVCLVTGATSGIGRATAVGLAKSGVSVVMLCRDRTRGELARNEIASQTRNQSVDLMIADLSSLASIRKFATDFEARYPRLDVLINDAATYSGTRVVTPEGFELMFATNYLGPFLLSRLLVPRLEAGKPSRIINVTAPSSTKPKLDDLQGERKFGALGAFGASKAADLLFTYAFARKLEGREVTANAYHPGIVRTGLMRGAPAPVRFVSSAMSLIVGVSPERASEGIVELATSDHFARATGQLFHNGKSISAPFIEDKDLQEKLWKTSCGLTGFPEAV